MGAILQTLSLRPLCGKMANASLLGSGIDPSQNGAANAWQHSKILNNSSIF
jgi:hypothetical protein